MVHYSERITLSVPRRFFPAGYLKLWQLSKPQLSGYDAIFVDEAQDCTPGEWRQQTERQPSCALHGEAVRLLRAV